MSSLLPHGVRRTSLQAAYGNAALWALGNGIAGSSLVLYLALELGAKGMAIGFLLAAPSLIGVLRIGAGWLLEKIVDRKRFTLSAYTASVFVLLLAPILCRPGVLGANANSLLALVLVWSGYHLLEYVGTISLWSWLGDLAPARIRGRFIGRRERYLLLGRVFGMLAGGLFTFWWRESFDRTRLGVGYTIAVAVGALFMLAAVAPLAMMAPLPMPRVKDSLRQSLRQRRRMPLWQPLADPRFQPLLWFGCWFSFSNGITQAAQGIYPARILGFHLFWMLLFRSGMRLGQAAASPTVGWLVDRIGNRFVMFAAQMIVATGPLFFLAASVERRWWLAGAWVVWIAYVGLNVGLTNLTLKLAPPGRNASYIATYFGLTGLCYGLSTIAGGALFDHLGSGGWPMNLAPASWDHFQLFFLAGWLLRIVGAFWLLFLIEPRAWRIWPHTPRLEE